jgi:hypothetical protein
MECIKFQINDRLKVFILIKDISRDTFFHHENITEVILFTILTYEDDLKIILLIGL